MDFLPEFESNSASSDFTVYCVPWPRMMNGRLYYPMVPPITEKSGPTRLHRAIPHSSDQERSSWDGAVKPYPLVSRRLAHQHRFTCGRTFLVRQKLWSGIGVAVPQRMGDVLPRHHRPTKNTTIRAALSGCTNCCRAMSKNKFEFSRSLRHKSQQGCRGRGIRDAYRKFWPNCLPCFRYLARTNFVANWGAV